VRVRRSGCQRRGPSRRGALSEGRLPPRWRAPAAYGERPDQHRRRDAGDRSAAPGGRRSSRPRSGRHRVGHARDTPPVTIRFPGGGFRGSGCPQSRRKRSVVAASAAIVRPWPYQDPPATRGANSASWASSSPTPGSAPRGCGSSPATGAAGRARSTWSRPARGCLSSARSRPGAATATEPRRPPSPPPSRPGCAAWRPPTWPPTPPCPAGSASTWSVSS
jgi:hypothetical protein